MPSAAIDLRSLPPAARLAAQDEAVAALQSGGVVLAPGDTGYVLLAAVEGRAAPLLGGIGRPATLLLPSTGAAQDLVGPHAALARKLLRVLTPGPAVFRIQLSEANLEAVREVTGATAGVIDSEAGLHLRVPGPSLAATLATRIQRPLASWEPVDAQHQSFVDAEAALAAASVAGLNPAIALADVPPTAGGPRRRPTLIAINRSGGANVLSEGAFEERYVKKHARLNILMVCTGNTCRSPMAEAIAVGVLARDGAGSPEVTVSSAGSGASGGAPHTPEGNEAVRSLGFTPTRTSSRALTRQMIAESDLIYAMARSNLNAVLAMDPSAADRAALLDPDGTDVPDPIGMPQHAYNATAGRIERMIRARLEEWRT